MKLEIEDGILKKCTLETGETAVTVPDGVKTIGDRVFHGYRALREVHLPDSVTEIGGGAFTYCTSLREIVLPEGVTRIGSSAFRACESLQEFHLPESMEVIAGAAFFGCTGLREIRIPEGVHFIGLRAFSGCTSLRKVCFPAHTGILSMNVFSGCENFCEPELAEIPEQGSPLYEWLSGFLEQRPEIAVYLYKRSTLSRELAEIALQTAQAQEHTETVALMLKFLHEQGGRSNADMVL